MSPTAQQDERTSKTLKIVSPRLADKSNPSEFSGTTGRKANSVNENREEPLPNVLLISIAYLNLWVEKIVRDEDGNEKTKFKLWELKAVQEDFELLLARHKCEPDANRSMSDAKREPSDHRSDTNHGPQRFFICADWNHGYTDSENTVVRTASKSDILNTWAEALSLGGSLVVYYSGHCSVVAVTLKNGRWVYEEDGAIAAGPAYLIPSDYQRIYAEDIYAVLSEGQVRNGGRKMTIMLIFDTCHAADFFEHVFKFMYTYRVKAIGPLKKITPCEPSLGLTQLIFVAATQFDQEAGTFFQRNSNKQNGAVTKVMREFLEDPEVPKTVEELVKRLHKVCHERQAPEIRALLHEPNLELLLV
ncbi:hypothetical protein FS837_001559 [Tulasnella sp. UAMH 9824]|nr:hypothetical protein FS837_001559 [Tulasnella sp. UAMH 9824]